MESLGSIALFQFTFLSDYEDDDRKKKYAKSTESLSPARNNKYYNKTTEKKTEE